MSYLTKLSEVLAINSENEITPLHNYAKPKEVIPFHYWEELCAHLGRWPTEEEQWDFYDPTPYCSWCNAKKKANCNCPPRAAND